MKVDTEMGRVVAFAKRMLQMAFIGEANYTAATLLVLSEVIDSRTDLRLHLFGVSKMESDDSDEEHFEDVDRSEHSDKKEEEKKVEKKVEPQEYDPLKIEPKFCAAATAPLWELVTLARHCHPTICLWAETILKGERIEYGGDPLLDFGL
jgi:ribosome biogenesis protein MAK21